MAAPPTLTSTQTPPAPVTASSGGMSTRLTSLDLFRGATIAAMILVNNPGNDHAYWPLEHAEWNGWTPTDLIFPFFLFIVGVSLVFSSESRLSRGDSRTLLLLHAFRRAVIIFAIGLALNWLVDSAFVERGSYSRSPAAHRYLLLCGVNPLPLRAAANPGVDRCGLADRLLDPDALRPGAGLRSSRPRHTVPSS